MPTRGRSVIMTLAVVAAPLPFMLAGSAQAWAGTPVPTLSETVASGGTWHNAIEVPGVANLNYGQNESSVVTSVSCVSVGNCTAGGTYHYWAANGYDSEAFVASEVNGTWQDAIGSLAQQVSQGGNAAVSSVSCVSAGNCTVTGSYTYAYGSMSSHVFVASLVNGTWQSTIAIPGTAALDPGGNEGVTSLSCPSAGNCTLGGYYGPDSAHTEAMVVNEVNGTWHNAIEVPGTAALNHSNAQVSSLSCASAGNCSGGGFYTDGSTHQQAFVASEVNGTWHAAVEVPDTAALNIHGAAQVSSMSCPTVGNCSVGGSYMDSSGHSQVFVGSELHGHWHSAIEVPGTAALNHGDAQLKTVSCASAGNCSTGGYYTNSSVHPEAFVDSEVNGHWHTAIEVPGTAALDRGGAAWLSSVSCASAGNCSAGGYYAPDGSPWYAFVVSEVNGIWHTAIKVPGIVALAGTGYGEVGTVSCSSAGNCVAAGFFYDSSENQQAFVVSES